MSLYSEFTVAIGEALEAIHVCGRTFSHGPHDLDTGHRCPGFNNPTLPADHVHALADTARKEIRR